MKRLNRADVQNKGQETKGDHWRDQRYMSDVIVGRFGES